MNLAQLTRLRDVCESAETRARELNSECLCAGRLDEAGFQWGEAEQATAALADIDAEIELLKGSLTDCVTLQVGRDGVWAHFRVGKGYAYSQNLSGEQMSKKFADEYIAKLKGTS